MPASPARRDAAPVALLLFSSTLWGLTWWPLKRFAEAGLSGPVLAMLAYGGVGLLGLVLLWRQRAAWRADAGLLLLLGAVGGWANASFVHALVIGDVVRVMLLFYLAPVWGVIGGRLFLGEAVRPRRALAAGVALLGLWLVIGGARAFDTPLSVADWLALSAGLGFTGNNIAARAAQRVPVGSKSVAVFAGCALVSAGFVLFEGRPWPDLSTPVIAGLLGYGFVWLLLSTVTWQYGVTRLEAGRAGVITVAELVVAVLSAAWFGGAHMSAPEWFGGALITAAALLEATDASGGHAPTPAAARS
ncbi:MAG: DMT family transporter [Aquabacterium sp.]|nr:MAG: DMT family transporter [Aquabacterium sp.]